MPVTRYYPGFTLSATPSVGPSGEQSAALPNGTNNNNPTRRYSALQLSKPSSAQFFGASGTFNSLAQTGRQSAFVGYGFYELGAQTIPAGNWSIGYQTSEGNAAANAYLALSIYVWRPSTSSVVGYVYDSSAELGSEFTTTFSSNVATVSGASVTAANNDVLVVELWQTAQQGVGMAYTIGLEVEANASLADITADGQTNRSGWIDAPDELIPKGQYKLLADDGIFNETGQNVQLYFGRRLQADVRSYAVAGIAAGLERIFPALLADRGQFVLTGNGAGLLATRNPLLADGASFTLTGTATDLVKRAAATAWGTGVWGGGTWGYIPPQELYADPGTFTLTGNGATLTYTPVVAYSITADPGTFTLSGQDAAFAIARRIIAAQASFSLAGNPAGFLRGIVLPVDAASYTLAGTLTRLLSGRQLTADLSTYTLTGNGVDFAFTRQLQADAGSYTLTGNAAPLRANRIASLDAGTFTVTGNAATLTQNRAVVSETGLFFLTRYATDLRLGRILEAGAGTVDVTGIPVVLTTAIVRTPQTASLAVVAVAPTPAAGPVTVTVGSAPLRLAAVAPTLTTTATVAVPPATVTVTAVAPVAAQGTVVNVPLVTVKDVALPPTLVPGTLTIPIGAITAGVAAIPPYVLAFIPVQAARVNLGAVAPAVTGGGGPSAALVLPKKTGD
jgi:hypothetical protein